MILNQSLNNGLSKKKKALVRPLRNVNAGVAINTAHGLSATVSRERSSMLTADDSKGTNVWRLMIGSQDLKIFHQFSVGTSD
jgi:hypothetical protein